MADNVCMGNNMHEALAKLLDEYDERRRSELDREKRALEDEAHFLKQFADLRRDVIRPVFEEAGAMLEERGHRYSIGEQEFVGGAAGRICEAGISLRVVASGTKAPLHEDQHTLSITTRHYNRTVWINSGEASNAGGMAGPKGAYALERVTPQLIEDEVISFVARVVAA
ncbi:MAG: hypothetical protein A3G81_21480 [Betaproteobacteria bacterium RIFCSPLOWO2_12_FULL_65_14]|nr:MAG: hypothetical protein A3G81_21480 [Betaproteobacteria bacterium RIFCSPLOWO2_12_FULL_65_14]